MKRIQLKKMAAMLALTLTVASPAYARHGHGSGYSGYSGYSGNCPFQSGKSDSIDWKFFKKAHKFLDKQEALGLSEDQVQSIHNLKMEVKKNLIRRQAEIDVLDLEIESKLRDNPIDVASIQKLVDQKYEAKKAFSKSVVEAYAKLKSTLTEEQRQTFKNLKKDGDKKGYHGGKGREGSNE